MQTENMIRRNILSIFTAVLIAYLSLSESDNYNKIGFLNFPGADKIVHFCMYFLFMSVIVFNNRKNIKKINILLLTGVIPAFYGILMEFLQRWLTATRTASLADILFDISGILLSIIICVAFKPIRNQIIR
jgi:VanZ family protein